MATPAPESPPIAVAPPPLPAAAPQPLPATKEPAATAAAETPKSNATPTSARAAARTVAKPAPEKAAVAVERPPKAPPRTEGNTPKCSDILQKASLEALTAEEKDYLRKECK